jgi:hypothetical protein
MDDSDTEDDSMKTRKLGLEELEARIAPSLLNVGGGSVHHIDVNQAVVEDSENVIINQDSQNKHTTFEQEG